MAKLSFEEWKLRKEYEEYLKETGEQPEAPAAAPESPEAPAQPAPAPAATPDQPEAPDYKEELAEIRKQLAIMATQLSPSLGDVQPVGIDDVVNKFFNE